MVFRSSRGQSIFTLTFKCNMYTPAPKDITTNNTCPLHELLRMVRDKDKKCCKNYKHGKRCKKCPKK